MAVDLIITFSDPATFQAALDLLPALGVTIRMAHPAFESISITAPDEVVARLRSLPGFQNLVRDVAIRPACCEMDHGMLGELRATMGQEVSPFQLGGEVEATAAGAPPALTWQDFTVTQPTAIDFMRVPPGLTGKGVKVAVLDTGVHGSHPALRDQVVQTIEISTSPDDGVGHGTWCAAAIAGREVDSPLGPFHGVAPDAKIVNINVLDAQGSGKLSDVLAGLEAALGAGVQIVNMSLGSPVDIFTDPSAKAIDVLTQRGILVCAAGGNFGPNPFTIGVPGSVGSALTVAAGTVPIPGYIDGGLTAGFSSRGPTLRTPLKPDVTAPGGGGVGGQKPELIYGPCVGLLDDAIDQTLDEWAPLRGTSMATPEVAGLMALLMERYKFTRQQLDEGLQQTSRRMGYFKDFNQGYGFIDGQALAAYMERRRLYRP